MGVQHTVHGNSVALRSSTRRPRRHQFAGVLFVRSLPLLIPIASVPFPAELVVTTWYQRPCRPRLRSSPPPFHPPPAWFRLPPPHPPPSCPPPTSSPPRHYPTLNSSPLNPQPKRSATSPRPSMPCRGRSRTCPCTCPPSRAGHPLRRCHTPMAFRVTAVSRHCHPRPRSASSFSPFRRSRPRYQPSPPHPPR